MYDHNAIEIKWKEVWEKNKLYKVDENSLKPKKYILDMFPYPSGAGLHVGHVEGYTATDILSRYYRLKGFNVLHPMGWDAFGLPAENYAVKTGVHPEITTKEAIKTFKSQMQRLGLSYDWDRELGTNDQNYYKWTQWLFLLLYKKGLAYKKEALVNWDPVDQTVLANEQVLPDGTGERSGAKVEQRLLSQWFFKITDYADRLIEGLDRVDWPESTKIAQKNWIGKSEGAEINFRVVTTTNIEKNIKVFTTRLDTIYGASFIALAPEHELVEELTTSDKKQEVIEYLEKSKHETELERTSNKDKTGVFSGSYAFNPFNDEKIPIWIADFVISTYAQGAIMGVPAHDDRDMEFAIKYNLPIIPVVKSKTAKYIVPQLSLEENKLKELMSQYKYEVIDKSENLGNIYSFEIDSNKEYELINFFKDNLIDRNDGKGNWYVDSLGTTNNILMKGMHFKINTKVDLENFKEYAKSKNIPVEQLDVNLKVFALKDGIVCNSDLYNGLSVNEAYEKMIAFAQGEGFGAKKVQYKLRDWLISRQRFWGPPIPIIYDKDNNPIPVKEEDLPVVLPMDVNFKPTGQSPLQEHEGFQKIDTSKYPTALKREADTLDTFVDSSWYFFRFCDPNNSKEFGSTEKMNKLGPVDLYVGGAEHTVLHLMYSRFFTKVLYDEKYINYDEPFLKLRHQGTIMGADHRKMSKRWGNVINPDDVCKEMGADTLRMYEMFMGPLDQSKAWSTESVKGIRRFLQRVYDYGVNVSKQTNEIKDEQVDYEINKLIKEIGNDLEEMKMNTPISEFMKFMNIIETKKDIEKINWENFLITLSPFAPFLAEELWHLLGKTESITLESWPKYQEDILQKQKITIVVQVNGKRRAEFIAEPNIIEEEAFNQAIKTVETKIKKEEIKKKIYVKGKLVSFVV